MIERRCSRGSRSDGNTRKRTRKRRVGVNGQGGSTDNVKHIEKSDQLFTGLEMMSDGRARVLSKYK